MDGKDVLCGQALPKQRDGLHSKVSYKRLEAGSFTWPPVQDGSITLSTTQLRLLFSGMDWTQIQARTSMPVRPDIPLEKLQNAP
jgi:transposase